MFTIRIETNVVMTSSGKPAEYQTYQEAFTVCMLNRINPIWIVEEVEVKQCQLS